MLVIHALSINNLGFIPGLMRLHQNHFSALKRITRRRRHSIRSKQLTNQKNNFTHSTTEIEKLTVPILVHFSYVRKGNNPDVLISFYFVLMNRWQSASRRFRQSNSFKAANHQKGHLEKSYIDKDTICIVIIFICLFIYFFIFYLYANGNFVIMETHRSWSSDLIQRDLPLLYSINTRNLPEPKKSYIKWLENPSTLCWNNEKEIDDASVFVLSVLYGYSMNYKLLIRNNRMLYASMNNYVYCELTDDTEHSAEIIKNFAIDQIESFNPFNRLWYKLHFIEYLMDRFGGDKISYFLWLDADAVLINLNTSISKWYKYESSIKSLFIGNSEDINSGVFILKNNDWARNTFLKYAMSRNMMLESANDRFGEQRAFYRFREERREDWNKNVNDAVNDLQISRYSTLYLQYSDSQSLPLSFHFWEQKKDNWPIIVECVMCRSQPLWLLQIIYDSTNRTQIYNDCKYNKLLY